MADYCHQCSLDLFGEDFGDLAGILSDADAADGMICLVLCEGCGPIQVDQHGHCLSADCLRAGHPGTTAP